MHEQHICVYCVLLQLLTTGIKHNRHVRHKRIRMFTIPRKVKFSLQTSRNDSKTWKAQTTFFGSRLGFNSYRRHSISCASIQAGWL